MCSELEAQQITDMQHTKARQLHNAIKNTLLLLIDNKHSTISTPVSDKSGRIHYTVDVCVLLSV